MYNLPTFYDKDKQLTIKDAFASLKQLNLSYNSRPAGIAAPIVAPGAEPAPEPAFEPTISVYWEVEIFASEKAFTDKAQSVSRQFGSFISKNDNLDLLKEQIGKELGAN